MKRVCFFRLCLILGDLYILLFCEQDCCMMTVSVLDAAQRPVWCISSSVSLVLGRSNVVCETYDGEQFVLWYNGPDGKLKMTLVWMQDLEMYFLINLHIWIRVEKEDA